MELFGVISISYCHIAKQNNGMIKQKTPQWSNVLSINDNIFVVYSKKFIVFPVFFKTYTEYGTALISLILAIFCVSCVF